MSVIPFSEVSGGLQAANCKSLLERANETITGLEEQRDLMQREVEEAQLAADRAREAAARAPLPAVKRPAIAQDLCPAAPSALLCSALLLLSARVPVLLLLLLLAALPRSYLGTPPRHPASSAPVFSTRADSRTLWGHFRPPRHLGPTTRWPRCWHR